MAKKHAQPYYLAITTIFITKPIGYSSLTLNPITYYYLTLAARGATNEYKN